MAEPAAELARVVVDPLEEFRACIGPFHRAFVGCLDAGVPLDQIIAVLYEEGVELPAFVLQMLGL